MHVLNSCYFCLLSIPTGVSVVSLDKALEVNHVTARVGDNVEIKCDVRGTPPPPIVWRRNDMDLSVLNDQEIKVKIYYLFFFEKLLNKYTYSSVYAKIIIRNKLLSNVEI